MKPLWHQCLDLCFKLTWLRWNFDQWSTWNSFKALDLDTLLLYDRSLFSTYNIIKKIKFRWLKSNIFKILVPLYCTCIQSIICYKFIRFFFVHKLGVQIHLLFKMWVFLLLFLEMTTWGVERFFFILCIPTKSAIFGQLYTFDPTILYLAKLHSKEFIGTCTSTKDRNRFAWRVTIFY